MTLRTRSSQKVLTKVSVPAASQAWQKEVTQLMTQELWSDACRQLESLEQSLKKSPRQQGLWLALGKLKINIVRFLVAHSCSQLIMGEALRNIKLRLIGPPRRIRTQHARASPQPCVILTIKP